MKLHQFKTYDEYTNAQCRGSRRRASRRPSIDGLEVLLISKQIDTVFRPETEFILCHGARCGSEVELFQSHFPKALIIGTDLAPRSPLVVQWDFQKANLEWMGRCDFVYSNSLDHASDPLRCVQVWLDQLKHDGLLFVTWCTNSMLPMEGEEICVGGDCYGATLHEYIRLFEDIGVVKSLLYVGRSRRGGTRVTIVAGRKHK